jgi:hypothetical protein
VSSPRSTRKNSSTSPSYKYFCSEPTGALTRQGVAAAARAPPRALTKVVRKAGARARLREARVGVLAEKVGEPLRRAAGLGAAARVDGKERPQLPHQQLAVQLAQRRQVHGPLEAQEGRDVRRHAAAHHRPPPRAVAWRGEERLADARVDGHVEGQHGLLEHLALRRERLAVLLHRAQRLALARQRVL